MNAGCWNDRMRRALNFIKRETLIRGPTNRGKRQTEESDLPKASTVTRWGVRIYIYLFKFLLLPPPKMVIALMCLLGRY